MKKEWLLRGAVVPVDVETTAALVAEIHRLIGVVGGMALAQPEQEPVAWGVFDGPSLHDMFFTEEEALEMVRLKGDGSMVKPLREIGFAKAELWIKRINDAVFAEREACAKVCDAWQMWGIDGALLAKAIRARGNTCTPPQTIEDEHIAKVTSDINLAVYKALAQPEQEPVAWMWRCKPYCGWPEWSVSLKRPADSGRDGNKRTEGYEDVPLYTTPQAQRILELEALLERQTARMVDLQTHIDNFDGENR